MRRRYNWGDRCMGQGAWWRSNRGNKGTSRGYTLCLNDGAFQKRPHTIPASPAYLLCPWMVPNPILQLGRQRLELRHRIMVIYNTPPLRLSLLWREWTKHKNANAAHNVPHGNKMLGMRSVFKISATQCYIFGLPYQKRRGEHFYLTGSFPPTKNYVGDIIRHKWSKWSNFFVCGGYWA